MTQIDWSAIAATAEKVAETIASLAPAVGTMVGPAGVAIAAFVSQGAALADAALKAAVSAGAEVGGQDLATIKAAAESTAQANVALSQAVDDA